MLLYLVHFSSSMTDSRKTKLGWFLVVAPIPLLIAAISGYAIAAFIAAQSLGTSASPTMGQTVQLLFGIGGLLGLLGIFVGMPVGIYLLTSRTPKAILADSNAQTPSALEYRSASAFAKTTIGLLLAFTLAASIDVFAQGAVLGYLSTFSFVGIVPSLSLPFALQYANITASVIFPLSAMTYLMWKYRAYRNIQALSPKETTYSHLWTVGGYIIPFINFFMPFRIMKEIVRESKAEQVARILIVWWIAFLVAQIILEITPANTTTAFGAITTWTAVGTLLWDVGMVIAAVSLMIIMSAVTKNQDRLALR
jgi:hypothetical protein